jgi:hypothetical protein
VLTNSEAMLKQTSHIYLKNPRNIEGIFASQHDTNNDNTEANSRLRFLVAFFAGSLIIGVFLEILKTMVFACREIPWLCIAFFFTLACFSPMWFFILHFNGLISLVFVAISAYLAQFWILIGLEMDGKFPLYFSEPWILVLIIAGPLPCTLVGVLILYFMNKKNNMVHTQK